MAIICISYTHNLIRSIQEGAIAKFPIISFLSSCDLSSALIFTNISQVAISVNIRADDVIFNIWGSI